MFKVVYINCDVVPFLDRIMALGDEPVKDLETRTRNMLRAVLDSPVLLAETRCGRRPIIRCWATFGQPVVVRSRDELETYLKRACIPAGSRYDWQPGTKVKYLYPIRNVRPCAPHVIPKDAPIIRHGRTWAELI